MAKGTTITDHELQAAVPIISTFAKHCSHHEPYKQGGVCGKGVRASSMRFQQCDCPRFPGVRSDPLCCGARTRKRSGSTNAATCGSNAATCGEDTAGPIGFVGGSHRSLSLIQCSAQTLVASTYPLEVIQLQQWLERTQDLKDKALADAVEKQTGTQASRPWLALPDVVKRLADNIQWTTDLGTHFLRSKTM